MQGSVPPKGCAQSVEFFKPELLRNGQQQIGSRFKIASDQALTDIVVRPISHIQDANVGLRQFKMY